MKLKEIFETLLVTTQTPILFNYETREKYEKNLFYITFLFYLQGTSFPSMQVTDFCFDYIPLQYLI